MKLILPSLNFEIIGNIDRVIIETNPENVDRELPREEIARRLGKTVRMIDYYRRLDGEARLHSSRRNGRVTVKESELKRWTKYVIENQITLKDSQNGSESDFRPRKRRGNRVAFPRGSFPSASNA